MIALRNDRLTYITASERQEAEEYGAKEKALINKCLQCPYSQCVYGYCDLVGDIGERRKFKKSYYYKRISKN